MPKTPIIIVTGVSGSGKTTALRALEESGYFCVDNLPATLAQDFLQLCEANDAISRAAVVMDARGEPFSEDTEEFLSAARTSGNALTVLFLDSQNDVLIRRFSETRRKHPFSSPETTVLDGIQSEREALRTFRDNASVILDTTHMNVHELRRHIVEHFAPPDVGRMPIIITSFGFKYGLPHEAQYVFDARFIDNPHFDPELRPLSGLDKPVRDYILQKEDSQTLLGNIYNLLDFTIPRHDNEGKPKLTIAVGCTGGRHRSVCLAEAIGTHLRSQDLTVSVLHRDVARH